MHQSKLCLVTLHRLSKDWWQLKQQPPRAWRFVSRRRWKPMITNPGIKVISVASDRLVHLRFPESWPPLRALNLPILEHGPQARRFISQRQKMKDMVHSITDTRYQWSRTPFFLQWVSLVAHAQALSFLPTLNLRGESEHVISAWAVRGTKSDKDESSSYEMSMFALNPLLPFTNCHEHLDDCESSYRVDFNKWWPFI